MATKQHWRCLSRWFDLFCVYSQLEAIIGGYQPNTSVGEFLSRLVTATQPITNDTTRRPSEISSGDLLIAVNILVTLAEYNNASQGNISSEEDVHNLATVVSNLLDPGNAITWQNLEQVRTLPRWAARPCVALVKDYSAAHFCRGSPDAQMCRHKPRRKLCLVQVLKHLNLSNWAEFLCGAVL